MEVSIFESVYRSVDCQKKYHDAPPMYHHLAIKILADYYQTIFKTFTWCKDYLSFWQLPINYFQMSRSFEIGYCRTGKKRSAPQQLPFLRNNRKFWKYIGNFTSLSKPLVPIHVTGLLKNSYLGQPVQKKFPSSYGEVVP
jgi:hypothetical protein